METHLWKLNNTEIDEVYLQDAAEKLRAGEVVAFPTETVYGLGADGLNDKAVRKIFKAKGRPSDNPLILHIADWKEINNLAKQITPLAKSLAEAFWPGPLTMIVEKSELIPDAVSAGLETVAIRMPSHPIARKLISLVGKPLAAPSANKSGKPSPTDALSVWEDMEGEISGIVDGGNSMIGVESTVVDTTGPQAIILRPGGITKEMLEKIVGEVLIDPAVLGNTVVKARAPGMKYRHYAPQAPMFLFLGEEAEEQIMSAADFYVSQGLKPALMTNQQINILNSLAKSWQNDMTILAEYLYTWLREFDRSGVDVILAEGVSENGLGLALMNRLRKAAGNNILYTEKGKKLLVQSGTQPPFL